MTWRATSVYVLGGAAFSAYAVWGSLLPFELQRTPLDEALAGPLADWRGGREWSGTDFIANILLFVPIGLCWSAAADQTRLRRWSVPLVLIASAALAMAIELAQIFIVSRTPSLLDVICETLGAAAGVTAWRASEDRIDRWARRLLLGWRRSTVGQRALAAYGLVLACVWLYPFDFTFRLNEIAHKHEHQRLLLPFEVSPDAAPPPFRYVAFAAAVPLGLATALCGCARGRRRPVARALVLVAFALAALTLAQVAVFSRTTDGTLVVAALPGATLGAALSVLTHRAVP